MLFLDEVAEIPLELQAKMLDTLQRRSFRRAGGLQEKRFEGRLVLATNAEPAALLRAGKMREDFFHRVSALHVHIPPLRARWKEDGEPLAARIAAELVVGSARLPVHSAEPGDIESFRPHFDSLWVKVQAALRLFGDDYPWPGNVRELENVVKSCFCGAMDKSAVEAWKRTRLAVAGMRPSPTEEVGALARTLARDGREGTKPKLVSGGLPSLENAFRDGFVEGLWERPGASQRRVEEWAGRNRKTLENCRRRAKGRKG